ncbi:MAG: hypothetical protein PUB18_05955 [bacterium]|nr:hypothetical protein [bacterium]
MRHLEQGKTIKDLLFDYACDVEEVAYLFLTFGSLGYDGILTIMEKISVTFKK